MFRGLTRPAAVLKTTRSPSQSIQTMLSCAEPSGYAVAMVAKFGSSKRRACSAVSPGTRLLVQTCRVHLRLLDPDRDPLLFRRPPGVLVLTEVLLRQAVDLLVRALGRDLDRAADRNPLVGVLRIDDGDGGVRVLPEVALLGPADRRVEGDDAVFRVHPDDRAVRRAVRPDRCHCPDVGVLGDERALLLRQLGHGAPPSPLPSGSNGFSRLLLPDERCLIQVASCSMPTQRRCAPLPLCCSPCSPCGRCCCAGRGSRGRSRANGA